MREKQKVNRYYGVYEKQFMRYFHMAGRTKGDTGATLLSTLERRLDNVIYKLGFAPSRAAARQTISHGHVHVNGRRLNIASYLVRVGDRVSIKDCERSKKLILARLEELGEPHVQNWIQLDLTKLSAEIVAIPTRDDVMIPVEEERIVELCSM